MTKSQIFLYLCLSFIFGIFIASLIKIPLLILGGIFVLAAILISVLWGKNKKIVALGFCLLIFSLAGFLYLQKDAKRDLSLFNDSGRLILVGMVSDLPDRRPDKQIIKVGSEKIIVGSKETEISGFVLVTVGLYPEYQYGDLLEISGQLKEPENFSSPTGEFDYKNYLAKSDIYSVIYNPEIKILSGDKGSVIKKTLFGIKEKFEKTFDLILPEPHSSFLAGLTLGEKRGLSEKLTQDFSKTGTTHIIALSGYNIQEHL
ncbi:MAG: ComEC family competence protein [Candidatus Portnoybacteria bacterium]|nr:ComEC family competence protein [Candidatus Portnoybacteria bacterium]